MNSTTATTAIPFDFDGHEVRTLATEEGEALFVAYDVAEALGYAKPENAISRHCKKPITTPKQGGGFYSVIRESDVYRLVVKSRLPSAERFEQWVFEDVLPTIRRTGRYGESAIPKQSMPDLIEGASAFMDALRIEGSSRITSMKAFAASNCPQYLPLLPDYAIDAPAIAGGGSSLPTASASDLLKQHGAGISASYFNKVCHAQGLLEKMTRTNSKGKEVAYWCVTQIGLEYGKNVTSPQSPRQTQPHWFTDKFGELLKVVGFEIAA
jgi:prophage antirepressor-like protein